MADTVDRWRAALEVSGVGLWDWNIPDNRIHYCTLWKAIRGLDEGDAGPQIDDWKDWVHPDDLPMIDAGIAACLRGDAPGYAFEHRARRKTGGYRWVLARGTATEHAPDGSASRIIGTNIDIDAAKQAGIDAAEDARLTQQQRLDALRLLSGGIAHDLNNLLTVIMGNSEALTLELGESDLGRLAKLILATGDRAADLTERLLTFASRQSLQPRTISLGALLPMLERAVPGGVELRVAPRLSDQSVEADPARLEMALLNLMHNARDALPQGGWIEIGAQVVEVLAEAGRAGLQPGCYVALSFGDNGSGMDIDTAERAFDPFFTTRSAEGAKGLGLSMVYGFARQSGGTAEIASRPGQGTTVCLYLPATAGAAIERREPAEDRLASKTVLIAEDDPAVRKFVASQVGSLGYRTIIMSDGKSAFEALSGDVPIDLLFTDIAMEGGMDGIELAGWARIVRPGLPVLFTSGHAEQHVERLDTIDALLLKKPYRKKDLAEHLARALHPGS